MTIKKYKMTDLQVVQRTLDFWDPLGTSLSAGGPLSQIDEYDSYAVKILEMLRASAGEEELLTYLDFVRFEYIALSRREESESENRFFAWALGQVWRNQAKPASNFRLRPPISVCPGTGAEVVISPIDGRLGSPGPR